MKNIIIAGGGLVNKGAQAMTLICICELKKRYPDHRILLLAWDASPAARAKYSLYHLDLLPVPAPKFASAAKNPAKRVLYTLRHGQQFRESDGIYRNTDLFIDISGYALGSNWNPKVCNNYLDAIEHALAYDIPVYLLPQSFGPFDYTTEAGKAIDDRTHRLFPKIKQIFAREQEGFDALVRRYGLTNVTVTHDMVLSSRITDYSPALREKPVFDLPHIPENSIALIPNVRVGDNGANDPLAVYSAVVRRALERDLYVYITHHSTQDCGLCARIKEAFSGDDRVILLEQDHSCMEFNELVKKFRFVVASRFHAIVHALKNGVPCIALGWATKYENLMGLFHQEHYVFDLRKSLELSMVEQAMADMAEARDAEAETIRKTLPELQKVPVFDSIQKA